MPRATIEPLPAQYTSRVRPECLLWDIAALGTVARARGMAKLARSTGLGRESLYKALSSDGNPSFKTVLNVAAALGYRFNVSTVPQRRARSVAAQ